MQNASNNRELRNEVSLVVSCVAGGVFPAAYSLAKGLDRIIVISPYKRGRGSRNEPHGA